ncbi:hypothetical protein KOL96_04300 (plasmid) [Ralstonia wenshanensis]|uniref:hypothetical protein n=1 Tax=Ralstonia wenshanensis TaxID=2842456 RepID=UPI001E45E80D|nr:hypothetical protein [Ralstonia wenshanensis]UGS88009.1 hypothetical protein KOL96_04300 [Ralstonia wenshanensis]
MPPSRLLPVNVPTSPSEYETLHDFAARTPSPSADGGDALQPRKKGGWLSNLKSRVREKLPKSDETELATLLSDRKRSGTSFNTVDNYKAPTRGTLTTTPEATPQATEGTPHPATPQVQERQETRRAARSQRKTSSMMQRAEQGAQRLRQRGKPPTPQAASPAAALTVPATAEAFRQSIAQLFRMAGSASERELLADRLGVLAAPAQGTSSAAGSYIRPMLAARALAATSGGNAGDALRVLQHVTHAVHFDAAAFAAPVSTPSNEGSTHSTSSSSLGMGRLFNETASATASHRSSTSDLGLSHLFGEGETSPQRSETGASRTSDEQSPRSLSRQSSLLAQYGSSSSDGSGGSGRSGRSSSSLAVPPMPQGMSDAGVASAAWRTAQLLSRSHHGFEALTGLMQTPPTPEQAHTARAFLQAADHVHTAAATAADPTALLHARPAGSGTQAESLAVNVMHAAALKLRGEPVSAQQAGVLFAWHQGFREDGLGSDLANTKARLAKFVGRTIPRVEKQTTGSHFWQMIGKKKSPLSSAALGMHGAQRPGLVKEMDAYTAALRTMIDTLAQAGNAPPLHSLAHPGDLWRGAILAHWAGLTAANAPLSDYALTAEKLRALQPEVGAAVSRMQRESAEPTAVARTPGSSPAHQEFAQLVAAAGLTDDADTRAWAQTRLDTLTLPQVNTAQAHVTQLIDHAGLTGEPPEYLVGLQPSATLLRYWSAHAGEAAEAPAFRSALERADKLEHPEDLKMQAPTIEDARKTIETLLTSMESGNKVRLSNGGWIGGSTAGVSTGLSHVGKALPVPVSVQLDANYGRGRQAVVEIGRSSHGRDVFVGTDRTMRASVGVGASVGYDLKTWGKRLRANLLAVKVTPFDLETGEPRGVVIRATRPTQRPVEGHDDWEPIKYDDKAAADAIVKATNLLFEHACAAPEHRPDADTLWNALAQHCGESGGSGGISISWVDQTKKRWRASMDASVGMNVRVSSPHTPVRIGPSARLRGEKTLSNTATLQEKTGTMRVEQFSVATGHKVTARGGLAFSVGRTFYTAAPDDNASAKAGESGKFTQSFTGGMPLGFNWKLSEGGHTTKVKMGYQNGKIADRVSYFDTEYRSVREYLAVVRSERDAWINMLAHKPGGTPEQAAREFEAYCETVEKHARPNQRYLNRHRLRPSAAREIEGHLALADLHRSIDPNSADAQASEALAQALLEAPTSRVPEKLAIVEQVSTSRSRGLTSALQLRASKEAEGTRELAAIKFG